MGHYKDKERRAAYVKKWRAENKARRSASNTDSKQRCKERNTKFIVDYLKTHPCIDCGCTDIRVLEFDHVRDEKTHAIAELIGWVSSLDKIKNEVSKYDIRCANCHRIKTYETLGHLSRTEI